MNERVIEFQYSNKTQHDVDSPEQRRVSLLFYYLDSIIKLNYQSSY